MNYKQKYKAALERARMINNGEDVDIKAGTTTCEYIFPELAESEDEKIRKEILSFCQGRADNYPNAPMYGNIRKWIAWLEKQSKNDSNKTPIWKHWKDGIAGNGEGRLIYLTKVGNTYNLTSYLGCECDYIELSELDNLMLEKQGSAWSEEDEEKIKKVMHILSLDGRISNEELKCILDWLKSIKQRIGE